MNEFICAIYSDGHIDEFDCDLMCDSDFCIADNCTLCSYFQNCLNCRNESYCDERHRIVKNIELLEENK